MNPSGNPALPNSPSGNPASPTGPGSGMSK
jgi:hypothetical protein